MALSAAFTVPPWNCVYSPVAPIARSYVRSVEPSRVVPATSDEGEDGDADEDDDEDEAEDEDPVAAGCAASGVASPSVVRSVVGARLFSFASRRTPSRPRSSVVQ